VGLVPKFGDQRVKVGEYANGSPKYITRRHYAKVKLAEKKLGYPLTIVQGSYNTTVEASKGTHDGGGCMDLAPFDWERKCRVLRQLGDTAWHRPAIPGVYGEHIHTVDAGCGNLASIAAAQVQDYRNKRNGLKGHAKDTQWRPDPIPAFKLTKQLIAMFWPQAKTRRVRRVDLSKVREQALAGGTKPNPGVKLIQRALNKAINARLLVDGKFGDVTKTAYTAWQKSLGFTGTDADGLPAKVSLTKLGQVRGARFVVSL
jgi:hypothetical protein